MAGRAAFPYSCAKLDQGIGYQRVYGLLLTIQLHIQIAKKVKKLWTNCNSDDASMVGFILVKE